MKKGKLLLALLWTLLCINEGAGQKMIEGYRYGDEQMPSGKEWESPQDLALNKELPHAWFSSFQDVSSALKVLPENSKYWKTLNGTWKFHFAKTPDTRPKDFYKLTFDVSGWDNVPVPLSWNIYGIQKDGSLKYGVPIYVNQPVIFQHKIEVDDWRGGVMRTPPKEWTTYEYRNEVGSFRRDFDIPADWNGREVFLNFDGVDCFFYLWVNGRYVGFSKNSRNAATFNIQKYLKPDKNTLAVEVYRLSDGSFLESQDMFRLPGIFRTVSLYSVPKLHIRDLRVTPDLDENYNNGSLNIQADVRNLSNDKAEKCNIEYTLYANKLYADETTKLANVSASASLTDILPKEIKTTVNAVIKVDNPNKWSAEEPYRYTLVAELKDSKGKTIETVSAIVGFRKVEIKDTQAEKDEFELAGRYYYVNGKTVKLRGVNRHETNPSVGHAITREMMENEIILMKRANINHVRNAHYPDDPYWYHLCDKYGIYLEDEANIESHEYYYGDASLSHPVEWKEAHVARVMEMAHANVNHPSIVIWSLGNEAGPGKNFKYAYDALKAFDISRPVQYERNNDIVDFGSTMYPSIEWVRGAVKGDFDIKYPFHLVEYAHSMGNACGNLKDYWDAMESTNHLFGGAIWDWIDQSMYDYDEKTGEKFLAYGGDFGDFPNDGQFVMNGLIFGDYEPKPQYYEVKKVYQDIVVKEKDVQKGEFEIFNKFYFKDLSDFDVEWIIIKDGVTIQSGKISAGKILPRHRQSISIPYNFQELAADAEYFINIRFLQKEGKPWAKKGYAQCEEQFLIKKASGWPLVSTIAAKANHAKPELMHSKGRIQTIKGDNFTILFDTETGSIHSLKYGNNQIISEGKGPRINALRAFVNNDNWVYQPWFENGLHNLHHKVIRYEFTQNTDGSMNAVFHVESQAPNAAKIHGGTSSGNSRIEELTDRKFGPDDFKFTSKQVYTVYADGSVVLKAEINSNKPELVLGRLGFVMNIPQRYNHYTYYGRGPHDNYPDRKASSFVGVYKSTVADQFVNFPKPQDMGNREDVRWLSLTDDHGDGAVFIPARDNMAASALQYSPVELILARHPYLLPKSTDTYLEIDAAVTGLGGNSCGQGGPLEQDRVKAVHTELGFMISPVAKDTEYPLKVRN